MHLDVRGCVGPAADIRADMNDEASAGGLTLQPLKNLGLLLRCGLQQRSRILSA